MPAKNRGSAGLDGTHDLALRVGQRVRFAIVLTVDAENVRDLEVGPSLSRCTGPGRPMAVHAWLSRRSRQPIERALYRGDVALADLRVARGGAN